MRRYIGAALVIVFLPAAFAVAEDRSADEQRAIDAIKALDGEVTVDEDAPGKPVVAARLQGNQIGDENLACLEPSPASKNCALSTPG